MATPLRNKQTFLEQEGYRRRRLYDVARAVPVLAAVLFSIPLLWPRGEQSPHGTADAAVYLFFIWAVMIAVTGALSRALGRSAQSEDE